GGLYVRPGGQTTLIDSRVTNNTAKQGAGVFNFSDLTLNRTEIRENTASDSGGGIYNQNALFMNGSTIADNTAIFGGGLYSDTSYPYLQTIDGSVIASNTGTNGGGGVVNFSGSIGINDSTITENKGNGAAGVDLVSGSVSLVRT